MKKKLSPDEKSVVISRLSQAIFSDSIEAARQIEGLGPEDMPNVMCMAALTALFWMEKTVGADHEEVKVMARHAVGGLIVSLAMNDLDVGVDLPNDLDEGALGLSHGGKVMGRA